MLVEGYCDVEGYLKRGHYECFVDKEDEEYFNSLSDKQKLNYIRENGDFLLDDWQITDVEMDDYRIISK